MSLNHLSETTEKSWMNIGCENLVVYNTLSLRKPNPSGFISNTPLVFSSDDSTLVLEANNKTVGGFGTIMMNPSLSPQTVSVSNVGIGTLISNSGIAASAGTALYVMNLVSTGLQNNNSAITVSYNLAVNFITAAGVIAHIHCGVNSSITPSASVTNFAKTTGDYQTLYLSGILDLNAGNILQLYLSSSVVQNYDIFSWQLNAHRV